MFGFFKPAKTEDKTPALNENFQNSVETKAVEPQVEETDPVCAAQKAQTEEWMKTKGPAFVYGTPG